MNESMEDLVMRLASLQADLEAEKKYVDEDGIIITLREAVADAKETVARAEATLAAELELYKSGEQLKTSITDTKAEIIELWGGKENTIQYPQGTLKFHTTASTKIHDGAALLATLLDHFSTNKVADEYLQGFKLTPVRSFIGVIEVPDDVVELVPKTTVKLEISDV